MAISWLATRVASSAVLDAFGNGKGWLRSTQLLTRYGPSHTPGLTCCSTTLLAGAGRSWKPTQTYCGRARDLSLTGKGTTRFGGRECMFFHHCDLAFKARELNPNHGSICVGGGFMIYGLTPRPHFAGFTSKLIENSTARNSVAQTRPTIQCCGAATRTTSRFFSGTVQWPRVTTP